MIPDLILTYNEFLEASHLTTGLASLFWLVEYSPNELGFSSFTDTQYLNSPLRFSLLRNECLNHPSNYSERLNKGLYRIWTILPNMNMAW